MPRPSTHTTDSLLDAAVALFARGGTSAVTMAGVAREARAPSGSVYHRFPDRGSLLAQTWLRTTSRFATDLERSLGSDTDAGRVVETAVWCVDWCRDHVPEAAVLNAGRGAFAPTTWPAGQLANEEQADSARRDQIGRIARQVARTSGRRADEVAYVLLELPLSVVRPHLSLGKAPPPAASDLVRRLASRVMGTYDPTLPN